MARALLKGLGEDRVNSLADVARTVGGYHTWLPPALLVDYWHAEAFRPEFLELEERLRLNAGSLVAIEEVAELATHVGVERGNLSSSHWLVRPRSHGVETEIALDSKGSGPLRLIPDGALVVAPIVANAVFVAFWLQDAVGGIGVTSASNIVLVPRTDERIGWLEEQLRSPMAVAQLQRVAAGITIRRVSAQDVLRVRVDRQSTAQRRERNARAVAGLTRKAADGRARRLFIDALSVTRSFVLTAASFDERLAQFERELLDSGLVDPECAFFVEAATKQRSSDLFVVRRIGLAGESRQSEDAAPVRIQEEPAVDREWRDWYWATGDDSAFEVFNTLTAEFSLPSHLVARTSVQRRHTLEGGPGPVLLPSFLSYRAAVETHRGESLEMDAVTRELADVWSRLNKESELDGTKLVEYLHALYRPVLAVKVKRDGSTAGVYLLSGQAQLSEPDAALAELSALGLRLAEILRLPDHLIDDAARRESLSRLSKMMHGLNGPLMRISSYINDMKELLVETPHLAEQPVPTPGKAANRAAMRQCDVREYSLQGRLAVLEGACAEMQLLQRRLREFRNAQGDLEMSEVNIHDMLTRLERAACEQINGVAVDVRGEPSRRIVADADRLEAALRQVIDNACRELDKRKPRAPRLALAASLSNGQIVISIADNALPADCELIENPFDEEVSAYRASGQGTGLGLASVRETIRRHGGHCTLEANRDEDAKRTEGVTFRAAIPASEQKAGR